MGAPEEDLEHQLRANTYGLLAHLFVAEPNRQTLSLLASISTQASVKETPVSKAWGQLFCVAKTMEIAAISTEFQQLFIGVARGELLDWIFNG